MIDTLIARVTTAHPEFTHEEVEIFCRDFLDSMSTEKIKEETKIKRLVKYIEREFELESSTIERASSRVYSLETIPAYLFESQAEITSSLVQLSHITKSIELTELFDDVSLQINRTDKIALIGKNGAGKTTLLKMIIGLDTEHDGTIELAKGLRIGYLSQDLFWQDTSNTLREEMLMVFPEITSAMRRLEEIEYDDEHWEEADRLKVYLREHDGYRRYELQTEILRYFGFRDEQLEQGVLTLSGGEQTKVQIARFLIREVDLLILDEPTNHLDIEGIIFLEHFCQIWKKAILSISHDVRFIDNTCERIIEISQKKLHTYPGNYSKYLELKQAKYESQVRAHETQKKELEKQEAYINRFRYQASKASGVQSRIKQLDKIERIELPENETHVRSLHIETERRLPTKVITLTDISVGYTSPIVSYHDEIIVGKSDKIGIVGRNGAGKSTFLKSILGEIPLYSGEISIYPDLTIGSYSQVLADLDGDRTILDELLRHYDQENEIRSILGGLLISGDKVDQYIRTLSGGERAKVALTKMLLREPDVIIMDEPTNHLDIHSKNMIKNMLANFNGVCMVVSHDRDLIESISTSLWLIEDGGLRIYSDVSQGLARLQSPGG